MPETNRYDRAYPIEYQEDEEPIRGVYRLHHLGLTKREYFASLILQGMLSKVRDPKVEAEWTMLDSVRTAIQYTDMLIDELNE